MELKLIMVILLITSFILFLIGACGVLEAQQQLRIHREWPDRVKKKIKEKLNNNALLVVSSLIVFAITLGAMILSTAHKIVKDGF